MIKSIIDEFRIGVLLAILGEKIMYIATKIQKGDIVIKGNVKLLICGYPSE